MVTDEEALARVREIELRRTLDRERRHLVEKEEVAARALRRWEAAAAVLDDRAIEYGRAVPLGRSHLFSGLGDAAEKFGNVNVDRRRAESSVDFQRRVVERLEQKLAEMEQAHADV